MSTDLELLHPPLIKINRTNICDNSSSAENDETVAAHQSCTINESDECHTPRSPRHAIPVALCCPPPPKKPRRTAAADSCRRKLMRESQFFEAIAAEEIESFFRTVEVNYRIVNGGSTKRKLSLM